jgi:hypothetical protein
MGTSSLMGRGFSCDRTCTGQRANRGASSLTELRNAMNLQDEIHKAQQLGQNLEDLAPMLAGSRSRPKGASCLSDSGP